MSEKHALQQFLERALAFAHAALDEPTFERLARAERFAGEVLPQVEQLGRFEFTLGEARQIVLLVKQLYAVLAVVERRVQARPA
jgi:hypothetical protein